MLGPVFSREATVAPKRPRYYLARAVYVLSLFLLLCTAYLVLAGTRPLRAASDLARFGGWMFLLLAPLQMLILSFQAAISSASSVAQEKDRRTLILLLLTRLTGFELVAGKVAAGLVGVVSMAAAALPLFLMLPLFGGVSVRQIADVYVVTLATLVLAACVGTVVGLWREKTFQTIAVTLLALTLWVGLGEVAATGLVPGISPEVAASFSPPRALLAAAAPLRPLEPGAIGPVLRYTGATLLIALGIAAVGIARVRVWNPSRELRLTGAPVAAESPGGTDERQASWKAREAKRVWSNPILWREIRTRAYGRKVLLIRVAYLLLFLLGAAAIDASIRSGEALERPAASGRVLPAATLPLAAVGVVSLIIVNALAVNSITGERDALALDLLLVTDLTPGEFVWGKILGVFYVSKEMILLPLLLLVWMASRGVVTTENAVYGIVGTAVLYMFVTTLGVHCGLNYAAGRTATLVSLGTVFFLCVGIAICMVIMVSFRGAFQLQLAPFLAMILGGGAALYAALGWRNPSSAIFVASFTLPLITFYAITQFLLQQDQLPVVATIAAGYGFATAAMLVPALSEFDVAMGRSRTGGEEGE